MFSAAAGLEAWEATGPEAGKWGTSKAPASRK
jgi:hypothetical protein